jgi:hypothetical protein
MTNRTQIRQKVQSLKPGDTVHIETSVESRILHVKQVEKAEKHERDSGQHYRVYLTGEGNHKGIGKYVINLDRPNWSSRHSNHSPPELFYIADEGTPPGEDEDTEGSITAIR